MKPEHPPKWQVRVLSREPTLIDDKEILHVRTMREALERMYTTVRRTSYMVEGPNREVMWALDRWNYNRQEWQCMMNGRSRLRKGAGPS